MDPTQFAAILSPFLSGSPLLKGCSVWTPRSRWQPLPALGAGVWMKREDELSFSMSGPKFRKMVSLSQSLAQAKAQVWLSWGSQRSAFLLALAQEARAQGVDLRVFLLRSTPWQEQGTDQLFQLWLEVENISWLARSEWSEVRSLVEAEAQTRILKGERVLVIPEGGDCIDALPGGLSLAWEIVTQEKELGVDLAEICLEAGSGFTAQALICGLGYLARHTRVEVLLCAGDEASFREGLERQLDRCQELFGERPQQLPNFRCHRPPTAKSYGAVNQKVWDGLTDFARTSGCLLDPLYGAKLYLWYRERQDQREPSLWIHGGGGLSVFGFPSIPGLITNTGQTSANPKGHDRS